VITLERLKERLQYDPETGDCTPPGGIDSSNGYRRIRIDGTLYYLHNLIWFLMTGKYPAHKEVDHEDLNKINNRWINLRKARPDLQQANRGLQKNNKLRAKGVSFCKLTGRYRADIRVAGKRINLGRRDTIEEAAALYADAAKQHYGEFARTG
jgi:hypothetical protein